MKITGLKTFVVATAPRGGNWVFVKIYTDQDGLTGLGEGTVTSKALTIAAAMEEHERFLVGRDPLQYAVLPTAPGLGVELNEAEAARHPYVADARHQYTFADGSVADA